MPRPTRLDPSLAHILQATIEKCKRHIHKAEPARVISYDAETQTAEVQPVIQIDMGPGGRAEPEFETSSPIGNVPVVWPGGAAGFLHVSLAPGDHVLLVHCDQDFSRWWVTGSVSPPAVWNLHDIHPVAIAGFNPEASPFPVEVGDHVTLAATSELRLGSADASAPVALAPQVTEAFDTLTTALDGLVTALDALAPGTKTAWDLAMATFSSAVAASKVRAT
jgi:hypothetical protein